MFDSQQRLEKFLLDQGQPTASVQLTPDASTREYFRVQWNGKNAIACVYPEPFIAGEQSYLDVTNLFLLNGLPVADIYSYSEKLGVIVLEDFGDVILRDVLTSADAERRELLIDEAIRLIARIQLATKSAFETDTIASRLKFDAEKLLWELEFFREHYFETLRRSPLSESDQAALHEEFKSLSSELESRATVLCHRDFHSANLMLDQMGQIRIIDQQDARIGTVSYDLVSLLLDRITLPPPAEWLAAKRRMLIAERISLGLEPISEEDLTYEFRLQTVQRCLKANGTFSFQSVNRGKTYFLPFIRPMFEIVLRAANHLDRFPVLREIVTRELQA